MTNPLAVTGSPGHSNTSVELTTLILNTLRQKHDCTMEELLQSCAPYTSNQIFVEMDRLSRTGEMCVLNTQDDDYAMLLPPPP